jgi:hypothetical protein
MRSKFGAYLLYSLTGQEEMVSLPCPHRAKCRRIGEAKIELIIVCKIIGFVPSAASILYVDLWT